ncbi:MAG TPA: glutathione peroxidase [Candidatus Acidoferrales bacterium]|jgi:glutathione peroxidase|nr:glutathione peroxidase [Candidatus Acidoferrales bacterium]
MGTSAKDIYDIGVRHIDGRETTLREYAGDVLLAVNVASECGLTPQYAGLEKLYEEKAGRGLRVLGFPCNQFGAQEPGTNEQIVAFCTSRFNVTFPLFDKIEVNGPDRHPLYSAFMDAEPGDVTWNFEKFLIDRTGNVVGRFAPDVTPEDPALLEAIDDALGS